MIIKKNDHYRYRYRIRFEGKDWDSGLALEINEVIKSQGKGDRYFDGAAKEWVISENAYDAVNRRRKSIRMEDRDKVIDVKFDDLEEMFGGKDN